MEKILNRRRIQKEIKGKGLTEISIYKVFHFLQFNLGFCFDYWIIAFVLKFLHQFWSSYAKLVDQNSDPIWTPHPQCRYGCSTYWATSPQISKCSIYSYLLTSYKCLNNFGKVYGNFSTISQRCSFIVCSAKCFLLSFIFQWPLLPVALHFFLVTSLVAPRVFLVTALEPLLTTLTSSDIAFLFLRTFNFKMPLSGNCSDGAMQLSSECSHARFEGP